MIFFSSTHNFPYLTQVYLILGISQGDWATFLFLNRLHKPFHSLEMLQKKLDLFMKDYNFNRIHTGYKLREREYKYPCQGFFEYENDNGLPIKCYHLTWLMHITRMSHELVALTHRWWYNSIPGPPYHLIKCNIWCDIKKNWPRYLYYGRHHIGSALQKPSAFTQAQRSLSRYICAFEAKVYGLSSENRLITSEPRRESPKICWKKLNQYSADVRL